jgi:hypothetical protein
MKHIEFLNLQIPDARTTETEAGIVYPVSSRASLLLGKKAVKVSPLVPSNILTEDEIKENRRQLEKAIDVTLILLDSNSVILALILRNHF